MNFLDNYAPVVGKYLCGPLFVFLSILWFGLFAAKLASFSHFLLFLEDFLSFSSFFCLFSSLLLFFFFLVP